MDLEEIPGTVSLYVTGFGKTGLIAGLVKIDFFPEKASTKFKYSMSSLIVYLLVS